jgi:hypothetical protein
MATAYTIPSGVNNGWISAAVNTPAEFIELQVWDNFSNVDGVNNVQINLTPSKAKSLIKSLQDLIKECE